MQIGEHPLEQDVIVVCAGDVAGAAGAGAAFVDCLVHRGEDGGVLPYAEIAVRAPGGDVGDGAVLSGLVTWWCWPVR